MPPDTATPSANTSGTALPSNSVTAVPTAPTAMVSTHASTSAPREASINVATDPKFGSILVGNNGMTLYAYSSDPPDQSTCTGGCANVWPALMTQGSPVLGSGVDATKVGTATLTNGSKAVTYNHMVLYYYSKDSKAGDTLGQGVGSVWYVVSPAGQQVGK